MVSIIVDEAYSNLLGSAGHPSPLNTMLIYHYRRFARGEFPVVFKEFISEHAWLKNPIEDRRANHDLYRQPAVLLVYFAVEQSPTMAHKDSILTDDELGPIYSDLGKSLP